MNRLTNNIKLFSLRFRHWSRKAYAIFKSIGKHVTIGKLKNIIADRLLGKQTHAVSIVNHTEQHDREDDGGIIDNFEVIQTFLLKAFALNSIRLSGDVNCYKNKFKPNSWRQMCFQLFF